MRPYGFAEWGLNDESSANKELEEAANVIQQMTTGTAGIPDSVLKGAKCIAVIPHLAKGAFIVGGEHGRGVATWSTSSGWSAPARTYGKAEAVSRSTFFSYVFQDKLISKLYGGTA